MAVMDDQSARATAPIAIAVDQLLKFGYCPPGSWLHKPLVSVAEATVLVDYYIERGTVDAFTHEQGPLLWRNKTAGVRSRCHLTIANNGKLYVWEFETENRRVKWAIPNITTNELFAQIEKGDPQPVADPMNIPIEAPPKEFHLNQVFSPESLRKWSEFLIWLLQRRLRQSSQQ